MDVNKPEDVTINRSTIREMSKDICDFINEHKKTENRAGLLEIVISEVADQIKLSPAVLYGVMECAKFLINDSVHAHSLKEHIERNNAFKKISKE